jgi:hypothetical protein
MPRPGRPPLPPLSSLEFRSNCTRVCILRGGAQALTSLAGQGRAGHSPESGGRSPESRSRARVRSRAQSRVGHSPESGGRAQSRVGRAQSRVGRAQSRVGRAQSRAGSARAGAGRSAHLRWRRFPPPCSERAVGAPPPCARHLTRTCLRASARRCLCPHVRRSEQGLSIAEEGAATTAAREQGPYCTGSGCCAYRSKAFPWHVCNSARAPCGHTEHR